MLVVFACLLAWAMGEAGRRRRTRTQLHEVAGGAHDEEADADGLADLDELLLVGC